MKTIQTKFILAAAFMFFTSAGFSQILSPERIRKRAAQRAEQRAEDGVNNRIDKSVDKVIDGLFGGLDKGAKKTADAVKEAGSGSETKETSNSTSEVTSEEDAMKMLGGLFGNISSAPAPEGSYNFKSSYIMKMSMKDKKGESGQMKLKYYFTDSPVIGVKYLEMSMNSKQANPIDFSVMDLEKNGMYTFMDMNGKKTMMSLSLDQKGTEKVNEKLDESMEKTTYTKIGETRTIAGYKCDGYIMEQDKTKMTVWISQGKVPVMSTYYKSFMRMNQSNSANSKINFNYASNPQIMEFASEGRVVLGMDSMEKDSETHMEVEEINTSDNFSFNTGGYGNMMDIGSMMKEAQTSQGNN